MKKSKRLEPLIKVVRQREWKLAGGLKKSMERCSAHELQLKELQTYRTQYRASLCPGQSEISARQLKDLWHFVGRLDEAIVQGTQRAAQSREQYWRDQQTFMMARVRTKVLEGLMSRYRLEEQRAQLRRENKEHDENAQRMATHGRSAKDDRDLPET